MTPIRKGDYAIAHIAKSGYSMLAGHYSYSRFWIVRVTKSTREGEVKEFRDCAVNCAKRVDRHTEIFSFPSHYIAKAATAFASQALDFTGHYDKAALKAALEATP